MIKVRIQIGDGAIEDSFTAHKLIYKEAENRTEAPIKKRDTSSYAEQAGEHTDPRTVQDAFDYKVQFIIEAPNRNLQNANAVIAAFNKKLYTQPANSDIRTYKEVTFYNDYKRVKIVGIPEPIAEPKELYRRQNGDVMDCAVVELTIHVSDPTRCDFDLARTEDVGEGKDIRLALRTDGDNIYVATSRPLKEGERVAFLTRGAALNRVFRNSNRIESRQPSHFRWHVRDGGLRLDTEGKVVDFDDTEYSFADVTKWWIHAPYDDSHVTIAIRKASNSTALYPAKKGRRRRIVYGVAIYQKRERMSNVAYFRSNAEILQDLPNYLRDDPEKVKDCNRYPEKYMRQWYSV